MNGMFMALVASYIFCQSGAPVVDNTCDGGVEANRVDMFVLRGDGLCGCAEGVTTLLRIERDGKVILNVPASAIDRDTLDKLWTAMQPDERFKLVPK